MVAIAILVLATTSALVHFLDPQPRLERTELVFGIWWLLAVAGLAILLYRGFQIADDARAIRLGRNSLTEEPGCLWAFAESGLGCGIEGLLIFLALLVLLPVLEYLILGWLVPAVTILLLMSIGGMLARAVNGRQECIGNLGSSLLWGAIWSTMYLAPIAFVAICIVGLLARR